MSLAAKAPSRNGDCALPSTIKHYSTARHPVTFRSRGVLSFRRCWPEPSSGFPVQIAGVALAGRIAAQVQDLEQIAVAMAARHRGQPRKQQPEHAPATCQTMRMLQQA